MQRTRRLPDSLPQPPPEIAENSSRQEKPQQHVDEHAERERDERARAHGDELAQPRGETDAQEREGECPGTQRLQRCDQPRDDVLFVSRVVVAAREGADEERGGQESQDELRKPAPDLRAARTALDARALPARRGQKGEHKGPYADPYV